MFFRTLLLYALLSRRVFALPFPYYTAAVTENTYLPLIAILTSLFSVVAVFLAIKFVYMKYRRTGTIHSPRSYICSVPTDSDLSFSISHRSRDKGHRGLLVGCLGSPAWETNLTSKLDGEAWRRRQEQRQRSLFAYRLHLGSTTSSASTRTRSKDWNGSQSSRLTKTGGDAVQPTLSAGLSRISLAHSGSTSRSLRSVQPSVTRYGDSGDSCSIRLPRASLASLDVERCASPSSVRLVDGFTHSNQVEYAFLSGRPPSAIVVSPLMGTRDSIQLSRCSLKCDRQAAPPLPMLPLLLPEEPERCLASTRLPQFRFTPLANVAKVIYSKSVEKEAPSGRVQADTGGVCSWVSASHRSHANNTRPLACVTRETLPLRPIRKASNHTRLRSCRGLAIVPRTTLLDDEEAVALSPLLREDERCESVISRTPSSFSCSISASSNKSLKPCLRQTLGPVTPVSEPMTTPSMSETSTQVCTVGSTDQTLLWTPICDVDIGMLGLDRFHWNNEVKELGVRSSHVKKDSVALAPIWE